MRNGAHGDVAGAGATATDRNYVVVSADTHASPDDLDHFLSYVDPEHREAVAGFGDLSSLAISMFGGFDPGEIDDADPVRATAARRLAGMGVDVAAAQGWLAHYGTDWVIPGDGGGRRLQFLEEQALVLAGEGVVALRPMAPTARRSASAQGTGRSY